MAKESVTDLSYLREIAMGDDEIVVETTKVFLKNTPAALRDIQKCFSNQDWHNLYKQAHKIKPNLHYMGMERAHELILSIEAQAKDEAIDEDLGNKIREFTLLCRKGLKELASKVEEIESA